MDGSEDNYCGTLKRVRWLFDDSFERSSECDGAVQWENLDHQPVNSSMAVEEFMDTCVYNTSDSLVAGIEDDTVFSSPVLNNSATSESVNGIEKGLALAVEDERIQATPCSFSNNSAPFEVISEPASLITPLEKQQYLQNIVDNVSSHFPDLAFVQGFDGEDRNNPFLTISQRNLFSHPPHGMTSRVYITIQYKSYRVHILMRFWKEGELECIEDVFKLCNIFSTKSKHKFCPGIDPAFYESEYHQKIRFHIKSVRHNSFPFSWVDSVNCKLLFVPAANVSAAEKEAREVKCPACKRLIHDLNLQRNRTLSESPGRKIRRQNPSSRARLQYMSPSSQQKRKQLAQYERSGSIRKLNKLEESEVLLDDEQNEEMCTVVESIQNDELEKLFQEGDQHSVGSLMKTIWFTDKERQKKEFDQDQARNGKVLFMYHL